MCICDPGRHRWGVVVKHKHDTKANGGWCWECLNEGYRRGRLAAFRELLYDSWRKVKRQRRLTR